MLAAAHRCGARALCPHQRVAGFSPQRLTLCSRLLISLCLQFLICEPGAGMFLSSSACEDMKWYSGCWAIFLGKLVALKRDKFLLLLLQLPVYSSQVHSFILTHLLHVASLYCEQCCPHAVYFTFWPVSMWLAYP